MGGSFDTGFNHMLLNLHCSWICYLLPCNTSKTFYLLVMTFMFLFLLQYCSIAFGLEFAAWNCLLKSHSEGNYPPHSLIRSNYPGTESLKQLVFHHYMQYTFSFFLLKDLCKYSFKPFLLTLSVKCWMSPLIWQCLQTFNWVSGGVTASQNGWGWEPPLELICSSRTTQSRVPRTMPRWLLEISKEEICSLPGQPVPVFSHLHSRESPTRWSLRYLLHRGFILYVQPWHNLFLPARSLAVAW